MGKNVLDIQGILDGNSSELARDLMATYERWRINKTAKENEAKEVSKYIFATDTTTTTNKSLPWRNSTTIPKICQIRDNLHANYMDALFPNDDWIVWVGDDHSSVAKSKRRSIEAYARNKAQSSGLIDTISKLVYDYIDYGNAFASVEWVNETHIDPMTGEEVTTYMGAKVFRISPYDHVFNIAANSYDESPKFTRSLLSIGDLRKKIKTQPELQYEESVVQDIIDARKSISAYDMEDINKSEGYVADGFSSMSEYLGSNLIEVIEFEGDWYDVEKDELLENRIITIVDGNKILRNIPNPNWLGVSNKVHVGWRDRPDNLYAMGALDNLVGLQYRLDHLENLKADAMDLAIFPPVAVRGEVEPFTWAPREQIRIAAQDGDVREMPPNPAVYQVDNEIAFIMNIMEEMAGAPKQAAGIRTPGEKTAFEVQTLENNAGRIFHNKTNKFERLFLERIMNLFVVIGRQNINTKDVIRVMDNDIGVVEFLTITQEDLTAKGNLRAMGSRHFAARSQLLQNINGVFNSPVGQMISPHTSRKSLTSLIEETMGLTKYNLFRENVGIIEDQETQRIVQQGQISLQAESGTPLEENLI